MSKQRVTLYIDPTVWRAVRLYTVGHGISASQFVENILEQRMMDTEVFEELNDVKSADKRAAQKQASNKPQPNASKSDPI